jgi:hypothetical protein
MKIQLTLEQQEVILIYKNKWQDISISTQPIDRDKVISVLKDVSQLYCEGDPFREMLFFDSPFSVLNAQLEKFLESDLYNVNDDEAIDAVSDLQILNGEGLLRMDLWSSLDMNFDLKLDHHTEEFITKLLVDREGEKRHKSIWEFLKNWLMKELHKKYYHHSPDIYMRFDDNFIDSDSEWFTYPALFDFYINELKYDYDPKEWDIYQRVLTECGCWFLPGWRHWIICDRPIKLLLDEEGNLHADGEPSIVYSDGFALHAEHGKIQSMVMPDRTHPAPKSYN